MIDPFEGACLSCKARRVRCDNGKPTCNRCQISGIECPGYVKIRQWTSKPRLAVRRKTVKRKEQGPERSASTSPQTDGTGSTDSDFGPLMQHIPSWLLSPMAEKDGSLIADSIRCLNKKHLPARMPPQPPFNRSKYEIVFDASMPRLFQKLLVVLVRTTEATNNDIDPKSDGILCQYRSQALAELKKAVERAVCEPHGFTLTCIVFFMLAELQDVRSGAWQYHLEAARKIILLRGGLLECFRSLPSLRPLLCNVMLIDIHAATTSHSSLLKSSTESQYDFLDVVRNVDEVNTHGFLLRLFLGEMVHTTMLRVSERTGTAPPKNFAAILESIDNFDMLSWVSKITSYGRTHPQLPQECPSSEAIAAWSVYASCYKSAVVLYLCLSCTCARDMSDRILSAKHSLTHGIRYLLNIGSTDVDAPIEGQIWRLMGWPIVLSTYVRIGWGIGEESVETEIERLSRVATETGRRNTAADFIRHALVRRWQDPDKVWAWDDGLEPNFPFFLVLA